MKHKEDLLERCDRYIRNELTETERTTFESDLKENPKKSDLIKLQQVIQTGISYNATSDMLRQVELWDEELISKNSNTSKINSLNNSNNHFDSNKNSKKINRPKFWISLAIAASVAFLMIFLQHKTSQDQFIQDNFSHLPSNVSGSRSTSPRVNSPLKEYAYNLYNIKEYKLAATQLEAVYEAEGDVESLLYAAVSNIWIGRLKKAKFQLGLYQDLTGNKKVSNQYLSLIEKIDSR